MSRKFIYGDFVAIPIDKIIFVGIKNYKVCIETETHTHNISDKSITEIQRQLMEAEK